MATSRIRPSGELLRTIRIEEQMLKIDQYRCFASIRRKLIAFDIMLPIRVAIFT
jgi:hypothetical protein